MINAELISVLEELDALEEAVVEKVLLWLVSYIAARYKIAVLICLN